MKEKERKKDKSDNGQEKEEKVKNLEGQFYALHTKPIYIMVLILDGNSEQVAHA